MLRFFQAAFAAVLLMSCTAQAAGDVGILDRLSGEVLVQSSGGNSFRATAFMKIRDGDLVTLAANGVVQIVYFDARKRELWQGAGSFRAGATGSTAVVGNAATVSDAKGVPNRELLAQAGNVQRLGSLTLRSTRLIPDDATIAKAHADYLVWTAAADPNDVLPELSMLGLLRERREPELIAPYLAAMQRKQPDSADVKALMNVYQPPAAKP